MVSGYIEIERDKGQQLTRRMSGIPKPSILCAFGLIKHWSKMSAIIVRSQTVEI